MNSSRHQGSSVLLVDDDDDIRLLWRLLLDVHGGFGPICDVSDGAEALEMITTRCFDVVITDFSMPVVSGLRVIEAARAARPETVIVMSSGTPEVADEALERGASAFFGKSESTTDRLPKLIYALLAERQALGAGTYAVAGQSQLRLGV